MELGLSGICLKTSLYAFFMSQSNNYNTYSTGNVLKITQSSAGGYDPVRITQVIVDEQYEKNCFEISFLPVKGEPDSSNKLVVQGMSLIPYILNDKVLLKVGFIIENHYYRKGEIVISKIFFPTGDQTGLRYNDWGYCIIESTQAERDIKDGEYYINNDYILNYKGSEYPPLEKIDELKRYIIPVNHIHTLQNYCRSKFEDELNVDDIDFS